MEYLFLYLLLVNIFPVSLKEPPGPWEKYNAVLSADYIIKAHIEDSVIIPMPSPYGRWEEKRVLARVKIEEIFEGTKSLPTKGSFIKLLLPSVFDFSEELEEYDTNSISYANFFKKHPKFLAALKYNEEKGWYESSSSWAYLSFFPIDTKNRDFIQNTRLSCPLKRIDAIEIVRQYSGISRDASWHSSIVGIIWKEGNPEIAPNDKGFPFPKLVWSVFVPGQTDNFFIVDSFSKEIYRL